MADAATDTTEDTGDDNTPPAPKLPQPKQRDVTGTPDDPDFIEAVHLQENPKNVMYGPVTKSGERAKGPGQFMQATWDSVADPGDDIYNVNDAKKNIGRYLNVLRKEFDGDSALALAAYNAGPGVIKHYQEQTENGTWPEVKALMAKKGAYVETQNYVGGVLGKYASIKGGNIKWIEQHNKDFPDDSADDSDTSEDPRKKPVGNLQDFKNKAKEVSNTPAFQTGSTTEQIRALNNVYNSGIWSNDTAPFVKELATSLWKGALPEEVPDFQRMVGAPPVVPAGQDPNKAMEAWKYQAQRSLASQGLPPELLGQGFDDYLNQSAQDEIKAYGLRNQSFVGRAADALTGTLGAAAEGAVSTVTSPIAGATRLLSGGNEDIMARADAVDKIPENLFGNGETHGFYAIDPENKRMIRNPDGTPQYTWQENLAKTVGAIPALISGTGAIKSVFGLGNAAITAGLGGVNALSSANGLFKETYQETGDVNKAYTASLAALPEAAAMLIPEMGILGGKYRPALASLSTYDKGRFLVKSMALNGGRFALGGAASDVIHQGAMNVATGKPFSATEVAEAAVTNAAGGAVSGAFYEYPQGKAYLRGNLAEQAHNEQLMKTASDHISDLRDSLDSKKIVPIAAKYFPQEALDFNGMHIEEEQNGNTTVAKNLDTIPEDVKPEEVPSIVDRIQKLPTPDDLPQIKEDILNLSEKQKEGPLTPEEFQKLQYSKTVLQAMQSPDYLHEIQRNENALRQGLAHPEALDHTTDLPIIDYDPANREWVNQETGERSKFAKPLLDKISSDATPVAQDLSDISHIKIHDEDAILQTPNPEVKVQEAQEGLNQLQLQKKATANELKATTKELNKLTKANADIDAYNAKVILSNKELEGKQAEIQGQINDHQAKIDDIDSKTKDLKAPETPSIDRSNQLDAAIRAETQKKLTATTPKAKKASQAKINALKAEQLGLYDSIQKENEALSQHKELSKLAESKQSLIDSQKALQEKLAKLQPKPLKEGKVDTKDLQDKLALHLENQKNYELSQKVLNKQLAEAQKAKEDFDAYKNSAKENLKKGLGVLKGNELYIKAGMPKPLKQTITAHELGHAVDRQLKLPDTVAQAIEAHQAKLEEISKISTLGEMADRTILPETRKALKFNEQGKAKTATPETKNALWGRNEILANQIGAILLKRAGVDIGDFHIIPALERYLSRVKLPELPELANAENNNGQGSPESTGPGERVSGTSGVEQKSASIPTEVNSGSIGRTDNTGENAAPEEQDRGDQVRPSEEANNPIIESEAKKEIALPYPTGEERAAYSGQTGETDETTFSKELRKNVPDASPIDYNTENRDLAHENSRQYIKDKGIEGALDELQKKKDFLEGSAARGALADEALKKASADFNANPTKDNADTLNRAEQLRAHIARDAAQTLSLLDRFRGVNSFADFYLAVKNTLKQAGINTEFTDYQLAELEDRYDKYAKAPNGKIKDALSLDAVKQGIKNSKVKPIDFLKSYYRTNLLSGLSTFVRVVTGHGMMGPLFTALSHPIYGEGMAWKVMRDALPGIRAENALIWRGESTGIDQLVNGLTDNTPLNLASVEGIGNAVEKFYNKFGKYVPRILNVISNTMTRLSETAGMTHEKYQELKETYKDNPAAFTAEVSKLLTGAEDLEMAKAQAEKENRDGNLGLNDNQLAVRTYEILQNNRFNEADRAYGKEYGDSVSLRGPVANLGNRLIDNIFNSGKWNSTPKLKAAKDIAFPFINALNHITDFSMDALPGSFLFNHADAVADYLKYQYTGEPLIKENPKTGEKTEYIPENFSGRSKALHNRLVQGQILGSTITAALMLAIHSGKLIVTGDPETVLNKTGGPVGKEARTGAKIREFEQKGLPEHSFVIPSLGLSFKYDDMPGLNILGYGLYKANKALANNEGYVSAATQFYKNAFTAAVPILGNGSLNRPYKDMINTFLAPEAEGGGIENGIVKFSKNAAQGLIPYSGLLKNVQKMYDNPEDSHSTGATNFFRNVPGLSSMLGSKNSIDRFGYPIQRTIIEHSPFSSIMDTSPIKSSPVWDKLNQKGLIVPEMNSNIKFKKGDFSSPQAQASYTSKRAEDRATKAYADVFTPGEWYDFRKATGPFIERAANQIASSNLPTDVAQKLLNQKVKDIETQAKKRYIATGKFD